ncbi:hypothetical protein HRI_003412800 [Hibiscus trionum]|uniref:Uncharacterized protein n=1 Tax=Hibiscus trionum TaxID=183268 RepID=A0A9W7ILX9_HIBTR|nr:hypothetical protein HRI_003412800 [Hibiscus trionum]
MTPITRRRCKTTRKETKPRRTHYKRKVAKSGAVQNASVLEDLPSNSSAISSDNLSKIDGFDIDGVDDISTATVTTTISPCSTPKARRFRIPETDTCPPAPKKQRVLSNCSLQRTPIAFFAPPDLELFFFFAHRDISV